MLKFAILLPLVLAHLAIQLSRSSPQGSQEWCLQPRVPSSIDVDIDWPFIWDQDAMAAPAETKLSLTVTLPKSYQPAVHMAMYLPLPLPTENRLEYHLIAGYLTMFPMSILPFGYEYWLSSQNDGQSVSDTFPWVRSAEDDEHIEYRCILDFTTCRLNHDQLKVRLTFRYLHRSGDRMKLLAQLMI